MFSFLSRFSKISVCVMRITLIFELWSVSMKGLHLSRMTEWPGFPTRKLFLFYLLGTLCTDLPLVFTRFGSGAKWKDHQRHLLGEKKSVSVTIWGSFQSLSFRLFGSADANESLHTACTNTFSLWNSLNFASADPWFTNSGIYGWTWKWIILFLATLSFDDDNSESFVLCGTVHE